MDKINRQTYSTDLNDTEWNMIAPLLPHPTEGRPRVWPLREILNALCYLVRSGCAWRLLPHDFPPWKTVYTQFWRWRNAGTWAQLNAALVEATRRRAGRDPTPPAIIDAVPRRRRWRRSGCVHKRMGGKAYRGDTLACFARGRIGQSPDGNGGTDLTSLSTRSNTVSTIAGVASRKFGRWA
jgi:transposase